MHQVAGSLQQASEQKVTDLKLALLLVMLMTFTVAAFALGFGKRHIVKPILRLNTATQAIANGYLDYDVMVESADEVGQLAQSFQRMELQLREAFNT